MKKKLEYAKMRQESLESYFCYYTVTIVVMHVVTVRK